ncbi:putative fructose-16-bisphosphatase cytosolic [Leptomonas pyrrhocoris]|uniref:fructose-bisphosphatase n=1 Tax=Leptomonas pyrrhocoris TaxID=157538 RepID=A0A0M9FT95_LEPPY|nr:putative fructose-16-bisphosphatase cytosolic [Leptomonas pyrrhocoris]XP_015654060.1 putative fructose-16-bisphosphatase cytosolic [Leptomonas pyrrhocoris]KPA75620.1 putative fructose-16-bisphosphatase cytosolic [Leptomonas pyrrhocoris]KPA75621.1 putative fructose-16-bisphosphatase cytosolic [Leptomonas pyrrhocoris]|eukprot:XP_015654059.1 putative fructose-16-bisphosphatase cytosolic [Leptomonas pyrrhocoris]
MEGRRHHTPVTMTQYIIKSQPKNSRGEFTLLMMAIQTAVKLIEKNIRRAGMKGILGYIAGNTSNATGDHQAKLDVISNAAFKAYLLSSTSVCVLGSEEEEQMILADPSHCGDYMIFFDPLDGSSNIDANVSVGSIWGVWRLPEGAQIKTVEDANRVIKMLKGTDMVSAGYAMYGSATNLVMTTGRGVDGFTLDPNIGEFILTHPHISIPKKRSIYSVNEGNFGKWDKWFQDYIMYLKMNKTTLYSARYIGSMVADVHRTLLYGGIFCYPKDANKVEGKLRYLYEAAPMSFLVEQAGGKAMGANGRVLDVSVTRLHQRTPVYLGSRQEVDLCMAFKERDDQEKAKQTQSKL